MLPLINRQKRDYSALINRYSNKEFDLKEKRRAKSEQHSSTP